MVGIDWVFSVYAVLCVVTTAGIVLWTLMDEEPTIGGDDDLDP